MLGLDWAAIVSNLTHVLVAYLIALPIGWERERAGAGMGLRTFPLVALASCGYLLVARDIATASPDAQSRVIQGLLGGIGFVGGGAIGLAVAFDRFEIAIVLGLVNFATLRWLTPFIHEVEAEAHHSSPSTRGGSDTEGHLS